MWMPLGIAETHEEGPGGLITFPITLSHTGPLLLTFSHDHAVEFSRGYATCNDANALTVNGMCACCICLCFDNVSILISNKVNINKPSPYKHKPVSESTIVFKNVTCWDWDFPILTASSHSSCRLQILILSWHLEHSSFKTAVPRENI